MISLRKIMFACTVGIKSCFPAAAAIVVATPTGGHHFWSEHARAMRAEASTPKPLGQQELQKMQQQ